MTIGGGVLQASGCRADEAGRTRDEIRLSLSGLGHFHCSMAKCVEVNPKVSHPAAHRSKPW